jgi:hypothetical protein
MTRPQVEYADLAVLQALLAEAAADVDQAASSRPRPLSSASTPGSRPRKAV